jgi:hypothetical protein
MEVFATADLQCLWLLTVSGLVSCQRTALWGRTCCFLFTALRGLWLHIFHHSTVVVTYLAIGFSKSLVIGY